MTPAMHSQSNGAGQAPALQALAADQVVGQTDGGAPDMTAAPRSPISAAAEAHHPSISVIIPALNEAANLPYVLPALPAIASEVVLIDGHSTDGTPEIACGLLPDIIIVRQHGTGKGDALRAGFAASTGDIIVMLDADGSSDPYEISRFVDALLSGADFAKGSRFLRPGGSTDLTLLRRAGNWAMNICVNLLFGTRFTDLCYGYNAFWRSCLNHFDVDCRGFEVEALIILRMCKANLAIVEVPSFEHARIRGASHLRTLRDGWRVFATILKERVNGRSVIKTVKQRHGRHGRHGRRGSGRQPAIAETTPRVERIGATQ